MGTGISSLPSTVTARRPERPAFYCAPSCSARKILHVVGMSAGVGAQLADGVVVPCQRCMRRYLRVFCRYPDSTRVSLSAETQSHCHLKLKSSLPARPLVSRSSLEFILKCV